MAIQILKFIFSFSVLGITSVSFGATISSQTEGSFKAPSQVNNLVKTDDVGVGLSIGNANGITAKFWATEQSAIVAQVGISPDNLALSADYLYHFRSLMLALTSSQIGNSFVPYSGLGAIAGFGSGANSFFNAAGSNTGMGGLRIPVGVEYLPRTAPLGVFAEVDPGLGFIPTSFAFFQGQVGGRWYF